MSPRTRPIVFLLLILPLASGLAALGQPRQETSHVVVISIDGLLPEYYLRPQAYGLDLPHIRALLEAGNGADGVIGQYPPKTYPSHASIVTGVRPARHGVYTNTILAPDATAAAWYRSSSYLQVPAIWETARSARLKTAAITWPVTADAEIDYLLPETGPPPPCASWPEQLERASTPGLARAIFDSLENFTPETPVTPQLVDRFSTRAAAYILRAFKPNLLLLHLFQTDSAQHRYGKHSPEARRAFEAVDNHIGQIVEATARAGLLDQTTFVITGDHGFDPVHSTLQPDVILERAGLIRTDPAGQIVEWSAKSHEGAVILQEPDNAGLGNRVRGLFEALDEGPYAGLFRIVERPELRAVGAYPGALLFLEPAEGYRVRAGSEGDRFVVPTATRGEHGRMPTNPGMHTGLILSGARIRAGQQLGVVRQIDIAPTVAFLLGIEMMDTEGVSLDKASFVDPFDRSCLYGLFSRPQHVVTTAHGSRRPGLLECGDRSSEAFPYRGQAMFERRPSVAADDCAETQTHPGRPAVAPY